MKNKRNIRQVVIALSLIFLGANLALANRGRWVEEERLEKCEKVVSGKVIKIDKFADLNDIQEIHVATVSVQKIRQDKKENTALADEIKVFFLKSKDGLHVCSGCHAQVRQGKNYLFFLTRTENIPGLKSGLFLEMTGDLSEIGK